MRRCLSIGILSAFVAGPAPADVFTFTGEGSPNDHWSVEENWRDSSNNHGVPGDEDRAIIPDDKHAYIVDGETFTVDTIDIQGGSGQIHIQDSGELILQNDDINCSFGVGCGDGSTIDGQLYLETSDFGNGPAGTLFFEVNDHIVSGDGAIISFEEQATIIVNDDLVFTSRLDQLGIVGSMAITDGIAQVGLFRNEGIVHATPEFDNEIKIVINIEDVVGAKWQAADCSKLTIFDSANLYGDFEDTGSFGGVFEFHGELNTCGRYYRVGCSCIEINELTEAVFRYAVFEADGSGCSNPGTQVDLWSPCTTLPNHPELGFEITSDVVTNCGCG